ncbi:MAG TPA: AMP-binding protein [Solirubrobacteraceae bacterium]|nr:AMP-binding protein [Solirubrobacteraceae bacterium]
MLVDSWLRRAAERHPDRAAVNRMTYAQLEREAARAARRLAARGVRPGERVGLELPAGEAFCVALHGCLLLGAVAVPIDVRLGAEERLAVARGVATVVDRPLDGDEADVRLAARHDLDAVAILVHTSGSSGRPKPVELTYGNWLWSALGSAVALGLDPEERWLSALPLSHVGGLSIVMRSAIGATTAIVHEGFDTERVLYELMRPGGATMVSLVPTTLQRLLDAGLREPPALRWALLGGAPISPALLGRAAAAGVPVATTYGLTEACSQVTTNGAPLFCTTVRLAPDGEILVTGPTVAPAAGPVLHTGDLGAWNADGALHVAGRKADTIVTGGENVAPAEVEGVLESHPAVAEAAVHGRADREWGEAVVATVVLRTDASEADLRAHCAARLAPFKVPKAIRFADALPRTRSGKLVRDRL